MRYNLKEQTIHGSRDTEVFISRKQVEEMYKDVQETQGCSGFVYYLDKTTKRCVK